MSRVPVLENGSRLRDATNGPYSRAGCAAGGCLRNFAGWRREEAA